VEGRAVSRQRHSPRPAPGKCRWTEESCRLLIEAAALTALELEARGEMTPFARDVLGTLGDVGERGLGTRSGLVVIEVPATTESRRRY